jgi:hypothetical protein
MVLPERAQRLAHQPHDHLLAAGEPDRCPGRRLFPVEEPLEVRVAVHDLGHGRPDPPAFLGQLPGLAPADNPRLLQERAGVLHVAQALGHRGLVDPQRAHGARGIAVGPDEGDEGLEQLERERHGTGHRAILSQGLGQMVLWDDLHEFHFLIDRAKNSI